MIVWGLSRRLALSSEQAKGDVYKHVRDYTQGPASVQDACVLIRQTTDPVWQFARIEAGCHTIQAEDI